MGPFEPNRLLSTREGAHFWRQRMKEEHTVERLPQSMHTELIQMDHKTSKLQLTSKNNHTPVYSRMSGGGGGSQQQLMEKLNYMIHLLEEQQKEPTQHILEEFLLYGLLGIFMIFLVDSFTRVGKYTR